MDLNFVLGAVVTDFPKASDSIPHDLLTAKLSTCSFSDETWPYIYKYLTNRRQWVCIKNTLSQLKVLISSAHGDLFWSQFL